MTLKAATRLAVVGAILQCILSTVYLVLRFIPEWNQLVYQGMGGIVLSILSLLAAVSLLIFFLTLSSKQA